MKRKTTMKSLVLKGKKTTTSFAGCAAAFSLFLILGLATQVSAQVQGPKMFGSAGEAAEALIAAAESFDAAALSEILGPNSFDLVHTGEPVADRAIMAEFSKLGREKKTIVIGKKNPNRAFLQIGNEDWPFPVPIVKKGGKWFFDTAAGRQEILYRRVGSNELDAIRFCRGFVEAQHEYALEKHDGAPVNQYAQHVIATAVGKHDGLAWKNADGTWGGPVGENAAKAIAQGYNDRKAPYHGYYFRVLKGQGPAAPLGSMDFVVNGYMIGGFALIAYPSQYQVTGVKTFMVSHDGVVYEKDLGVNTLEVAKGIDLFNPDKTWSTVFVDE